MAYSFPTNPGAGGYVTVATPGTAVNLLAGKVAAQGQNFRCAAILLTAGKAPGTENTGRIYIGEQGMNKTTGAGVVLTLEPGETNSIAHTHSNNLLFPEQLWMDADTAADGARIAFLVA